MSTLQRLILLALAATLLVVGGCDFDGLRENPNEPEVVPEDLQLSAVLGKFTYEVVANEPVRSPSHFIKQLAWNGTVPNIDQYDHTASNVDNLWTSFSYTGSMQNARIMAEQAEENGNYAYAAIGKTILAFNLGVVTDLWGGVPWSEAFDPANTTPAYDTQQEVYTAIFELLDEAQADFDRESTLTPGTDDLLYGGDMERWEQLAHTLEARFHMHLTEAPGNDAAQRAQQALDALAHGFQSLADDADFAFGTSTGSENPWYQWVIDSKWDTRDQLSQYYVNLLKQRMDPRLPIQARQAGAIGNNGPVDTFRVATFEESMFSLDDSTYLGHQNGLLGQGTTNISSVGAFYSAPGAAVTWISYVEAKFIEAEATLITQGAAAADPIYREAIAASMNKLGVDPANRDAYIDERLALTEAGVDALEAIMVEKYVANFLNLEAYNDWRRTGYPELEPVTNNDPKIDVIPLRYPYPTAELNNNAANVEATGIPQGYSALRVPVWWDTTN